MEVNGNYVNCHRMEGSFYREDSTRVPVGNLQVYRGDTAKLRIMIKDELGDPVDLTGAFIRFSVKYEEFCEDYVFYAQSDQGTVINVLNAEEGLVEIKIPHTETETWDIWPYWFDVEVTTNPDTEDAHRQTVIKGRVEIVPDITI